MSADHDFVGHPRRPCELCGQSRADHYEPADEPVSFDEPSPEIAETLGPAADVADEPADAADVPAESSEASDQAVTEDKAAINRARAAMPVRHYDWPSIKRRYVEGVKDVKTGLTEWPTLDACAAHFSAGPSRVREVAAKEGWRAQRSQFQAQVEATRQQAKMAAFAKHGSDIEGRAIDAAKVGLSLIVHRLQQIAQRRDVEPIDSLEQQRLAAAADIWHKIGLRAVGDPETLGRLEITGANGQPIEIAAELRRDNPDRLADVMAVLHRAGIGDLFTRESAEAILNAPPIIDAELVEIGPGGRKASPTPNPQEES